MPEVKARRGKFPWEIEGETAPPEGQPRPLGELLQEAQGFLLSLPELGVSERITAPFAPQLAQKGRIENLEMLLRRKPEGKSSAYYGMSSEEYETWKPREAELNQILKSGEGIVTSTPGRVYIDTIKPAGLLEWYRKSEQPEITVAQTPITVGPVTLSAGEWAGFLGLTIAAGTAVIASLPIAYHGLMKAATLRNINAWSMKTNTPIDPKLRSAVAD